MPRRQPPPTASGSISLSAGDETYLYRAYCQCGDLLYVGIARNLFNRQASHVRDRKPWERKAVRLDWDLYPTRNAAAAAERKIIESGEPIYNIAGRHPGKRVPRWRPLPNLAPPPPLPPGQRCAAYLRRIGVR